MSPDLKDLLGDPLYPADPMYPVCQMRSAGSLWQIILHPPPTQDRQDRQDPCQEGAKNPKPQLKSITFSSAIGPIMIEIGLFFILLMCLCVCLCVCFFFYGKKGRGCWRAKMYGAGQSETQDHCIIFVQKKKRREE